MKDKDKKELPAATGSSKVKSQNQEWKTSFSVLGKEITFHEEPNPEKLFSD